MTPSAPLRVTLPMLLALVLCQVSQARTVNRVIIDAGHGGKDKGAHRGKVYEKTLALSVAKQTEALLKKKGMPVTMTRRSDVFISLTNRAAIANRYKNCVFISIHFNAHKSNAYHGVETYYYGTEGSKLAAHIHLRMLSRLKIRNRDTRQRKDLAVLRRTRCPAVLIECGYISNAYERKRCLSASYQQNCARAIADGIIAYKNFKQ
ncbi:N-acetylmuramoyl-L-alanine amidase [Verrucomicrobiaceae bacterium R5-34]|uniref:N-acetylmuramoyl-L-alanine amidase n=1 Tax=Oceaniferula flava TaxID=2800421 RepID=A0AAE2SED9_9BACT|nr:N-acetylmuramoyl-L-alanine amidase [Oceaniferula flavus]MBK1831283.1 N-acetylmuramoyl-L-alanine amidase [Verrucomicrobiaceae bacterium R5-34]MBK1855452.1 N-acetylmuramoyl-L-alanine amidase [Oceaniferula flavus]MBM1136758.1 N-acetylmuramoyl-L-alanine amidase [Oceaniferula flavus]